jgi:hypothetical protein
MGDSNDDKSKQAQGQPKRPFATIDLKATEVKVTPAAAGGAADASATKPAGSTAVPASGPAAKTDAAKDTANAGASAGPAEAASAASGTKTTTSAAAKPPTAPSPTAARGGNVLTHAAAGVAGGALTLAAAVFGGLVPGSGDSDVVRRVSALEQVRGSGAGSADLQKQLADLSAQVARFDEQQRGLRAAHSQSNDQIKAVQDKVDRQDADGDIGQRLVKLEEQLGALSQAAGTDPRNGRVAQLAQIVTKLTEVETRLNATRREIAQDLEQRVGVAADQAEAGRTRLAQRAQSIEQSLKSVSDDTASLRASLDAFKSDVDTRIKATARPADVSAAVAPVAQRLGEIERNLQSVVRSEQDRNATAGNILLSLELANLKRALDRGGKYASELASVKKLAGDKLDLAVLEASQSTGVPSVAALTQELRTLAHSMIDAELEPADATLTDRMLSGMKSIVRVRRTNLSADDTSAEAIVGRMESLLKDGLVAEALGEARKLSAKALAPARGLIAKLEMRQSIDAAIAALDASLKTSLAGGAEPKKGTN